jgi:hypothetical protein
VTLARVGLYRGTLRLLSIAVEMLDQRVTPRRAAGWARTLHTPAAEGIQRLIGEGWKHHPCLVSTLQTSSPPSLAWPASTTRLCDGHQGAAQPDALDSRPSGAGAVQPDLSPAGVDRGYHLLTDAVGVQDGFSLG